MGKRRSVTPNFSAVNLLTNRLIIGDYVKNKEVIIKFFPNINQKNSSKLMTKTLGKIGFIDRSYTGVLPKADEFWRARIVEEVHPGEKRGCFLLEPIWPIEEPQLSRILPGLYTEELKDGILYIYPTEKGKHWIIPLAHKKFIRDVYAILVCLEKDDEQN